ncbi:sensor domain-containing diguanylate cyclase [Sphingomonas sp. UV9]|uniref:sensor domain-containing diguanylate cyclase n=1 Tax=Sphingomonas sp. UV9 TaxID=1851410 RepID=UPI000FFC8571|nr:sensor domain-containing diguanylate cyclase [Sphingomonas sp. UV9]RXD05777.1 sensor domain-containing diguanylate cyclase [Sphingomonas sp. UV9]
MRQTFKRLGESPLGPAVLGIAYFTIAMLSLVMMRGTHGIAAIWPPSGILLATLLIVPRQAVWRFAVAAIIASLAANLFAGSSFRVSAGFTAANGIEAMVATLLLRRRSGGRVSFINPSGLSAFLVASSIAAMVSAGVATCILPQSGGAFILSWFSTVWLGMLLVTPLLIAVFEISLSARRPVSRREAINLIGIVLLTGFATGLTFYQTQYPMLFVPMMVIVIAVLRGGMLGGIISMMIVTIFGSLALWLGSGPIFLIRTSHESRLLFFQFYLLSLFVSALPMATLLAARDRLRINLSERIRLLDQAEAAAHVGHWRVNSTDQAIFWSPEVFRVHGLPAGKPPALAQAIDLYHQGDRQRVSETVANALVDGKPFAFEARIIRPDDSIRHVETQGERDYSSRENAIGLFGLIRDVTEQIEARQVLQDSRDAANRSAAAAMLLASTDVLTGLANRRGIIEYLDVAVADTETGQAALSVVLFDIDHFKTVNDRYGHDVGDEVIKRVASSANECLRTTDLIGRYGGEEFVIILPGTDAEVALQIAERVRAGIEASSYDRQPNVTVSLGIASTRGEDTGDGILKRADIALYEAKGAGRNRLRLAS